jgi:hypothetical protein
MDKIGKSDPEHFAGKFPGVGFKNVLNIFFIAKFKPQARLVRLQTEFPVVLRGIDQKMERSLSLANISDTLKMNIAAIGQPHFHWHLIHLQLCEKLR